MKLNNNLNIVGNGVDIVDVKRFDNIDTIKRFLSANEFKEYLKLNEIARMQYAASRFALREAIIKSCPDQIDVLGVEIYKENNKLVFDNDIYKFNLSISHEKDYAIAYCICIKK